jgi:metal-sulfur cluster biosynthetic enzyme/nitrite reductase/ring-hydroxylating ferredoxin subunit
MPIAYQNVAKISEIPAGEKLFVEVEDQPVALFNVDGQIYAIDDVCTHDGGPLADGKLTGHEIECDRHGARFDIRTGSALCMPAVENVRAHHVKLEGDSVFVAINDSGDLPKEAPRSASPATSQVSALAGSAATVAASSAETAADVPARPIEQETIVNALKTVIDPELNVNVVDLGLVYTVQTRGTEIDVEMTLTTPACPAGPEILRNSVKAIEKIDGVTKANVKLVMNPPWSPARMTDDARDILGIF